jgi:hypothetical protein
VTGVDTIVNQLSPLNSAVGQLRRETSVLRVVRKPHSLIVHEFPPPFEEFRAKRLNLLWRGSGDGFTPQEFHRRCDGRANTLTLISDTDGNLYGGFTPVKWESASAKLKDDDSLRRFLFTLRNPHHVPPRKFGLRAKRRQYAIYRYSGYCAAFGSGYDTTFSDFFTGGETFTVKEIEVFEIAD